MAHALRPDRPSDPARTRRSGRLRRRPIAATARPGRTDGAAGHIELQEDVVACTFPEDALLMVAHVSGTCRKRGLYASPSDVRGPRNPHRQRYLRGSHPHYAVAMSWLLEARGGRFGRTDPVPPRTPKRGLPERGLAAVIVALAAACCQGSDAPAPSRGDRVAATCVTCHHPSNAHIPSLDNVSGALLAAQAEATDTIMHRLVAGPDPGGHRGRGRGACARSGRSPLISRRRLLAGAAGIVAAPAVIGAARPRVVVVGGGFGGATCARYLHAYDPSVEVTLVEPATTFVTCPMSNRVVASQLPVDRHRLRPRPRGRRTPRRRKALGVDPVKREIVTRRRPTYPTTDWSWRPVSSWSTRASTARPGASCTRGRRVRKPSPSETRFAECARAAYSPSPCPTIPIAARPDRTNAHRSSRSTSGTHNPRAKVLILDAKDRFTKQPLFEEAWRTPVPGHDRVDSAQRERHGSGSTRRTVRHRLR